MHNRHFYVYIVTNKINTVLYTGISNDLIKRIYQHKHKLVSSFTSRYNITKLAYYEIYNTAEEAIKREKQIKSGSRKKKIELVNSMNPKWKDLYDNIIR